MAGRMVISTVFRAVDKVTRPMRKMTRSVSRGAAVMGRALKNVLKLSGKLARGLLGASAQAVKFGGASMVGLTAAVTLLNKATVKSDRLSQAVKVSTTTMEALASAIAPAGFELDHIVDLVEEMNNKFGESAGLQQTLPVQESLAMLGLKFEELKKLKPEEQFKRVSNAILNLKDSAKAVSAADILFGGEANKIFGVLRDTGKDFDGLIARYKELNFQTDESRRGAGSFVRQLGRVTTLISTMSRYVAGLVGDAMAPMIATWGDWVVQNKELIRSKVVDLIARLPGILERMGTGAAKVWETMGKWAHVLQTVTDLAGFSYDGLKMLFNGVGVFIGESVAKIVLLVDKVVDKFRKAMEFIKSIGRGISDTLDYMDPFGGDVNTGSRNGAGRGGKSRMSSPQERTANLLEEKRVTNTTEVVIKDSTGKAQVVSGGNNPGFNLTASGGF